MLVMPDCGIQRVAMDGGLRDGSERHGLYCKMTHGGRRFFRVLQYELSSHFNINRYDDECLPVSE